MKANVVTLLYSLGSVCLLVGTLIQRFWKG